MLEARSQPVDPHIVHTLVNYIRHLDIRVWVNQFDILVIEYGMASQVQSVCWNVCTCVRCECVWCVVSPAMNFN